MPRAGYCRHDAFVGGGGSCWRCEAEAEGRTKAPAYQGKGVPDCLNATVLARNEKHAIKIVNEKRAQIIAAGEWE